MDFKVAIYTLTRDRLDYTKRTFCGLQKKAGYPYDHFVIDNGSSDGTQEWLKECYKPHYLMEYPHNKGISIASNHALDMIGEDYDLIIKLDNDCEIESDNIIERLVEIYSQDNRYFLSPRVNGLKFPPPRVGYITVAGQRVGVTGIIGGLFHCLDGELYSKFRYSEDLNLASGQDEQICAWIRNNGGVIGYLEGMTVSHMDTTDGQTKKYPDYFERKYKEEQSKYEMGR